MSTTHIKDLKESQIQINPITHSRIGEIDMNNIPFGRVFSDHMLLARHEAGTWHTPEIVPFGKLSLSPSVCSLHYGQTVFEGLKALRNPSGKPVLFRPIANYKRMNHSAYRLSMPQIPEYIFMEGLKALIALDKDWVPPSEKGSLYIRPLYFATDEYIGIRPSDSYIFTIFTCPVGAYYSKPVSLLTSREFVRAAQGGTGSAKCAGNYAGSILPDQIAKSQGYDNVLWLDARHHSYIEECGTMNVFFVIDDVVITPPLTGTILPGINRDSVITLLKDNGYKVEIRPLSIFEVESAYEQGILQDAFGAGTAATIAQIDKIGFAGRDLILPKISNRKVSTWLRDTLQHIKAGTIEDNYCWTVTI